MNAIPLQLGFIPLTDCAPLVVAREQGFFAEFGLDVTLSREPSWANIRDKVVLGVLDGAQMLAPMPLAITLGLSGRREPMVTAWQLSLNGNAITVSDALFQAMAATSGGLKAVIAARQAHGQAPLTFATVFPFSMHAYQLRAWLAAADIDPDRDVQLLVVPPARMVDQLRAGLIDGFCVGEPWNSVAVEQGLGHILATGYDIRPDSPEKVLGVRQAWAEQHPDTHRALLQALLAAARWLDQPDHRRQAATLIARPEYVDVAEDIALLALEGRLRYHPGEEARVSLPRFHVFHQDEANRPSHADAAWMLAQMQRWGQGDPIPSGVVEAVYRRDLFAQALKEERG